MKKCKNRLSSDLVFKLLVGVRLERKDTPIHANPLTATYYFFHTWISLCCLTSKHKSVIETLAVFALTHPLNASHTNTLCNFILSKRWCRQLRQFKEKNVKQFHQFNIWGE